MTAVTTVTTTGETSALCASVGVSRAAFYRRRRPASPPRPRSARAPSPRALGAGERQAVLDVLHSDRFVDQAPAEVHATLLEEQTYLCSPRTMYRILADAGEVRERRDQVRHPVYAKPELVATAPNQIWSWDITKLKGPVAYLYFSLYVILDLFSRHNPVVGMMPQDVNPRPHVCPPGGPSYQHLHDLLRERLSRPVAEHSRSSQMSRLPQSIGQSPRHRHVP